MKLSQYSMVQLTNHAMEKLGKVKIVHANMKNKENEFLYKEEKAKEFLL